MPSPTLPRRRLTSGATEASEKEEDGEDDKGASDLKAAYAAFQTAVTETINTRETEAANSFIQLIQAGGMDDEEMEEQMKALHGIFESISRSLSEAGKDLQEQDKEVSRKALKAQSVMFQLKLETARTAGEVAINNQKAEMEAVHHRQLEEKIQDLGNNGDNLLKEAHEKQEELEQKLSQLNMKNRSTEETLKSTQKLLRAEEEKTKKLQKDNAKLEEESKNATDQLNNALKDIEGFRDENKTLAQRVQEIVTAYEDAKKARDELQAELDASDALAEAKYAEDKKRLAELEEERDHLMGRLQHVSSEMDRMSVMHVEELKAAMESLSARLKDEILAAQRGEMEAAEAQHQKQVQQLLADLKGLGEGRTRDEQSIAQLKADVKMREDQLKATQDEFEAFKKEAARGSNADAMKAREEVKRLEKEIAKCKGDLDKTMSNLDIKIDENMTLGEQIKQLVDRYEAAQGEVEKHKSSLAKTLKELNIKTDENMTLGEQIQKLVKQYEDAQKDISKSKNMLTDAMSDLSLVKDENKTLGQQIQEMVDQYKRQEADIAESKQELARVLADLDLTTQQKDDLGAQNKTLGTKNKTLIEQIHDLVSQFEASRDEVANCRANLEHALSQLGVQLSENKTLSEHLNDLLRRIEDLKRAGSAHAKKLAAAQEEIERSHAECAVLKAELKSVAKALNEALASIGHLSKDIGNLKGEKRSLVDQVKDLVVKYRTATSELDRAGRELAVAVAAMDSAIQEKERVSTNAYERVKEIQQESARERSHLVTSALTSMQELRTHLAYTMSGVRVQAPVEDPLEDQLSFITWKQPHRWGRSLTATPSPRGRVKNAKDAMVVRLVAPDVPPLGSRPLPPASRATTAASKSPRKSPRQRATTAPDGSLGDNPGDRVGAWSATANLPPVNTATE